MIYGEVENPLIVNHVNVVYLFDSTSGIVIDKETIGVYVYVTVACLRTL